MIVLGITPNVAANPAASIVVDGELVAMGEEERYVRIKHAPHMTPLHAIKFCLEQAGVTIEDVDYVSVGFKHRSTYQPTSLAETLLFKPTLHTRRKELKMGGKLNRYWKPFYEEFIDTLPPKTKVVHVPHHIAHAASAYYVSGFDRANIITLDGRGEHDAGLIAFGEGAAIKPLRSIHHSDSFGAIYELVTKLLGFRRHSEEGKTMGLAAYGQPYTFPFITYGGRRDIPSIDNRLWKTFLNNTPRRYKHEALGQFHENLAASVQEMVEQVALRLNEYAANTTGCRNLCVAGGVGLNCVMNGKLIQSPYTDHIFVQPASSDAGCSMGAALYTYTQVTGKKPTTVMKDAYWGNEYSNAEIEKALEEKGVSYTTHDNITEVAARLLAQNKVVGWMQGRYEVGARALGARSILANPANPDMKDIVNKLVKFREMWRPFAPSMQYEAMHEYLVDGYESPFMILSFTVPEARRHEIISAVHVDGTCRPQTVRKEVNPRYWQLLEDFKNLSGVPVVLNTSFNIKGEPIVNRPQEAIDCLLKTQMHCLVIGNYLIEKH